MGRVLLQLVQDHRPCRAGIATKYLSPLIYSFFFLSFFEGSVKAKYKQPSIELDLICLPLNLLSLDLLYFSDLQCAMSRISECPSQITVLIVLLRQVSNLQLDTIWVSEEDTISSQDV